MVSVVIPTCNRPEDLERAVISLSQQSVFPKEVIVVDDGSSVPVNVAVSKSLPSMVDFSILRNDKSMGANHARNVGVNKASSEIICFLDDDDEFYPEKIKIIIDIYCKYQPDLIFHKSRTFLKKSKISYLSDHKNKIDLNDILVKNQIGGTSMVAVKKNFFEEIGGFDEKLPALQDWEAWIRVLKNKGKIFYIERELTKYNLDIGKRSISKSLGNYDKALSIIYKKYENDINSLSGSELKLLRENIESVRAFKGLVNKRNIFSSYCYVKCFFVSGKLKYLVASFFSLFGARFLIYFRGMKDKRIF